MGMILLQVGAISGLVVLVIFIAFDDKRNRKLREIEDQEEESNRQITEARGEDKKDEQ